MNYFELFSIPVSFTIDLSLLSNTYRELQKQYHPDKFAMHTDNERLVAMQKSTEINDAYQTLKDTCLRAEYLLVLAGYDIELQKTLQDTNFLIQQMALREKLAAFGESDQEQMDLFSADIAQQALALESQIEDKLASNDLDATADCIRKLKFMLKLQSELESLEEKLFD